MKGNVNEKSNSFSLQNSSQKWIFLYQSFMKLTITRIHLKDELMINKNTFCNQITTITMLVNKAKCSNELMIVFHSIHQKSCTNQKRTMNKSGKIIKKYVNDEHLFNDNHSYKICFNMQQCFMTMKP
jgi:hypothetical protein